MTPKFHRFSEWRARARELLSAGIPPSPGLWIDEPGGPGSVMPLFSASSENDAGSPPVSAGPLDEQSSSSGPGAGGFLSGFRLPRGVLRSAEKVCAFRSVQSPHLLYSLVWRMFRGERELFDNPLDEEVDTFRRMERLVSRDIHKMHAFVRFKMTRDGEGDLYSAWHQPDHYILRLAAPFFVRRFGSMRWTIFTPDESVLWNKDELKFGAGVAEQPAIVDELEASWKAYYGSTFNPARLKISALKKEMPTRYWHSLPETALIPGLIREASTRIDAMRKREIDQASPPPDADLDGLAREATHCRACPLWEHATQAVFGRGSRSAALMIVGEQPGDREDIEGSPFVGPAGQLLDEAFARAALERPGLYLTNAVKHFKWEPRGKVRLHKKPDGREIVACRPWLLEEIRLVRPKVIVCLGVTAAHAVMGQSPKIQSCEGSTFGSVFGAAVVVTYHPSAILRVPDEHARAERFKILVAELKRAGDLSRELRPGESEQPAG